MPGVAEFVAQLGRYPKPAAFNPSYGTAGFRAEASLLPSTVNRCGALMALRSIVTGQVCGMMITASHNPARDNGVKLIEPTGDMLNAEWEQVATDLARAVTDAEAAAVLSPLLPPASSSPRQPVVLLACDTRASGPELSEAATSGITAMGAEAVHVGQLTTPQLHWMVKARNAGLPHSLQDYYAALVHNFEILTSGCPASSPRVLVDCANGVGAQHLEALRPLLLPLGLDAEPRNTGDGDLNLGCGSEHVQSKAQLPASFAPTEVSGARCCSMDGDADRLVYFTADASGQLQLLDGDVIASLAASLLQQLIPQLPGDIRSSLQMGMVQTAYANGASTQYMEQQLRARVVRTKTGVKHLHHAAQDFDVGVYFEANGHGTVLFKPELVAQLQQAESSSSGARQLLALSRMMNQTAGDALSNILLVEAVLRRQQWTIQQAAAIFSRLPCVLRKVLVSDRSAITTTNAETTCVTPPGLQEAIDAAVARYTPHGRSFVRPSGTEDVVRVYAEAGSEADAVALALEVSRLVFDLAGGVGERP